MISNELLENHLIEMQKNEEINQDGIPRRNAELPTKAKTLQEISKKILNGVAQNHHDGHNTTMADVEPSNNTMMADVEPSQDAMAMVENNNVR